MSRVILDSTLKKGRQVLNRVERTEYSQASNFVYTRAYPLTLTMFGTGQMSRLNALCLDIRFLPIFVIVIFLF